jgi:hypothetical protein
MVLLETHIEADDPTLFITDYDNALINALKHEGCPSSV